MIDLSLLNQLVTFAEVGTLSKTAEVLHTSQPALTRSMKKIEEDLGVILFDRKKNHMELNATGLVAVDYAKRVLQSSRDFETQTVAYDRSLRTINIGFCAPVPQTVFTPILNDLYQDMTISADMKDDRDFCSRILNESYQLAVLHHDPNHPDIYCKKCGHEDLFLSLSPSNPLAFYPELHLKDLNGKSILLLQQIGFWLPMVRDKMPDSHFILQSERQSFEELTQASDLPYFSSCCFNNGTPAPGRINVNIRDAECHVDYYLACRKSNLTKFKKLFDYVNEQTIS